MWHVADQIGDAEQPCEYWQPGVLKFRINEETKAGDRQHRDLEYEITHQDVSARQIHLQLKNGGIHNQKEEKNDY
jgi:hypothetical protein